jgi:hypothetical protein
MEHGRMMLVERTIIRRTDFMLLFRLNYFIVESVANYSINSHLILI